MWHKFSIPQANHRLPTRIQARHLVQAKNQGKQPVTGWRDFQPGHICPMLSELRPRSSQAHQVQFRNQASHCQDFKTETRYLLASARCDQVGGTSSEGGAHKALGKDQPMLLGKNIEESLRGGKDWSNGPQTSVTQVFSLDTISNGILKKSNSQAHI